MKSRGFSIVELTVVIVVISILLVIGMVSFNNYQANARDEQRKVRAENIARYLDTLYSTGSATPAVAQGSYPSTDLITGSSTSSMVNESLLLSLFGKNGFDSKNLQSAGKDTYGFAVNLTTTPPTPGDTSRFVYQPTALSGTTRVACTSASQECRSFALYYTTEVDNVVHMIASKHQ